MAKPFVSMYITTYIHTIVHAHNNNYVHVIPYSAIFWRRKILANLANNTRIAKLFPAKTAWHPPNFPPPNILIVVIHQSFVPPKNCAIR